LLDILYNTEKNIQFSVCVRVCAGTSRLRMFCIN